MLGRLIAKNIIDNCEFEVFFTKSFLKQILSKKNFSDFYNFISNIERTIYMNDLQDVDAELHKSMQWILENDVEHLGFTFT